MYLYVLTANTYVTKANKTWLLFFHSNVILPGNTGETWKIETFSWIKPSTFSNILLYEQLLRLWWNCEVFWKCGNLVVQSNKQRNACCCFIFKAIQFYITGVLFSSLHPWCNSPPKSLNTFFYVTQWIQKRKNNENDWGKFALMNPILISIRSVPFWSLVADKRG